MNLKFSVLIALLIVRLINVSLLVSVLISLNFNKNMAALIGPNEQYSRICRNFCECTQMQWRTLFRVVRLDVGGADEPEDFF